MYEQLHILKELADFYQLELQKVKSSTLWKKATPFVFILVLLIFVLGLGKYIETLPKQRNPIEEYFNSK
jgi:Tfp pilus assembly protein PilO